jgi:hypothetical protein
MRLVFATLWLCVRKSKREFDEKINSTIMFSHDDVGQR